MFDIACGMASTPAPTIVFTRFITLLAHDADPATPPCFGPALRRAVLEACESGRPSCSSGKEFMAAYEAMLGAGGVYKLSQPVAYEVASDNRGSRVRHRTE